MSITSLEDEYQSNLSRFERLRNSVVSQISDLLDTNEISLGVPIESRVKQWISIEEKIQRKELTISDLSQLQDLIGIRLILLFRRDIDRTLQLLKENFDVVSMEDTGDRLGDSMFGYQSQHLVLKIPKSWLSVPSFSSLGDLHLEFQVRTLAQHIWAAVSHKLQYKNESGVPPPVRRTINRASALLETVDLEFDRVLSERQIYVHTSTENNDATLLNVDSLSALLDTMLPAPNKGDNETYAELLSNLNSLGVVSTGQLRDILSRRMNDVLKKEASVLKEQRLRVARGERKSNERLDRGVFYMHVGLVRFALRKEFGDKVVSKVIEEQKT